MCFVRDKVNVTSFVVPFKGKFERKFFNSPFPPKMEFPNNPICAQFEEFTSSTIIDRVKNGSLVFWGRVGQVEAPHLVMPITVEPSKPRICHDERFLNLWIKDCLFSLDYLSDLLRHIGSGHYQTVWWQKWLWPYLSFPLQQDPIWTQVEGLLFRVQYLPLRVEGECVCVSHNWFIGNKLYKNFAGTPIFQFSPTLN